MLKQDLDILIDDMMYSEMDVVIVLDGKEGTGKSRNARLIAKYISHVTGVEFNHNNIHFSTFEYIKYSESKPKYNINVLDESREALNKKRGMSKSNVFFTNWLSENRDKQQVHIIVLPAIHDLDNYISVWRMSLLINCLKKHIISETSKSKYVLDRGYFKVFENGKDLQIVLQNKQRYGYYSYPRNCKYFGRFKDVEPFDENELRNYKDKKAKQRKEKYADENKLSKEKQVLLELTKNLRIKYGLSDRGLANLSGDTASHMFYSRLSKNCVENDDVEQVTQL